MTQTMALAHRPKTWADLVGQEIPVRSLTGMLQTNTLSPGYLFTGTSGCGKTSAARLFGKRLLCANPQGVDPCNICLSCRQADRDTNPNLNYIDGTDRSLEFVRGTVVRTLQAAPINAPYRVMIIDEIHQYRRDAISPFLLLLERMPPRSILIACTTEDVLPEIRSRCTPMVFSRLPTESIVSRVLTLLPELPAAPVRQLVNACHGCFRAVWSILDAWQPTGKPLTEAVIRQMLGSVPDVERAQLWDDLANRRIGAVTLRWRNWMADGAQALKVGSDLIEDLIAMAGADPTAAFWAEPLTWLSGTRLINEPSVWLPALLAIAGKPYKLPKPEPVITPKPEPAAIPKPAPTLPATVAFAAWEHTVTAYPMPALTLKQLLWGSA